jgi:two-component system chemotaxis response regulator CheY
MSKTVLSIDDSKAIRDMVAFTLGNAGYRVIEAENGLQGLDKLRSEPVSLVIVDLNMPVMNGFEFIKKARSDAKGAGIPILMLTTESRPEAKAEGKALGATGWLNKPFDANMLLTVTRKLAG